MADVPTVLSMLLGTSFGCLREVNLAEPRSVTSSLLGTFPLRTLLMVPCMVVVNPFVDLLAVFWSISLKAGRSASLLKFMLTLVFSPLLSRVVPRGVRPAFSRVLSRTLMFSRCLWLSNVLAHYVSVYRVLLGLGPLAQHGTPCPVLIRLLRIARWGWSVSPGTWSRHRLLRKVSPLVTLTPLQRAT